MAQHGESPTVDAQDWVCCWESHAQSSHRNRNEGVWVGVQHGDVRKHSDRLRCARCPRSGVRSLMSKLFASSLSHSTSHSMPLSSPSMPPFFILLVAILLISATSAVATTPPLFEVTDVPGKGRGLVACKTIPKGTRILAEKPLITLRIDVPTPNFLDMIEELFLDEVSRVT